MSNRAQDEMNYPAHDAQYEDHAITEVDGNRADGWSIRLDHGWHFGVPKDSRIFPHVGMIARLYCEGIGSIVRGLFLDGTQVFYRTEDEQQAQNERDAEEADRTRRYDFEKNRADLDRRFAALPSIFQQRIAQFRQNNADFRWEHEPYELFCCEQAILIAETLKTEEAIRQWHDLSYEEQVKIVPISDGHSGNTMGCAEFLARLYLTEPALILRAHGALAPLVGCEAYGCAPHEGDDPDV
jgi:hypothetical protein